MIYSTTLTVKLNYQNKFLAALSYDTHVLFTVTIYTHLVNCVTKLTLKKVRCRKKCSLQGKFIELYKNVLYMSLISNLIIHSIKTCYLETKIVFFRSVFHSTFASIIASKILDIKRITE